MGCSISRATAGVVEATKTDAIRIAAKPVNSRPLEPRIWSVVSERLAQPPTRACVPIMHVWLCRGLVAMHEPPASYQVPWPRGYATVTPPSWVSHCALTEERGAGGGEDAVNGEGEGLGGAGEAN